MWRFYNIGTGIMLPRKFIGSDSVVKLNTPAGYAAIPGDLDHLSQRVDVSVQPPPPVFDTIGNDISPEWYPPVVDYQPPAPPDTQWETYSWDAGTKRWVPTPTLAAIKRDKRNELAAAWNQAKAEGVTFGTKTAPTDADSWTRYLAIKEMASDGGWIDVPIPLADGTFELMTQAKMVTLWNGLKAMERTLLTKLRDKVEAVAAAATQAEVEAVTWV